MAAVSFQSPHFFLASQRRQHPEEFTDSTSVGIYIASGMSVGALVGSLGGVVGVCIGGAVGCVLGIVIAIAIKFFHKARVFQKGLPLFEKISKILTDPPAIQAIQNIKLALQRRFIFKRVTDYYSFHQNLMAVTQKIKGTCHQMLWESALRSIDGLRVTYPDRTLLSLNVSVELECLHGQGKAEVVLSKTDPSSKTFLKEIEEIFDLEVECFGKDWAWSREVILQTLRQKGNGCFLVRERNGGRLLGVLVYMQESAGVMRVASIGRRVDAMKRGVGETLLGAFLEEQHGKGSPRTDLYVRKGNRDAIALYAKFGFQKVGEKSEYYRCPKEDADVMLLNWDFYLKQRRGQVVA